MFPTSAIARTGNLERFISVTTGSSVSFGSLFFTKSILTRTSFNALSDLKPASNSSTMFPPLR